MTQWRLISEAPEREWVLICGGADNYHFGNSKIIVGRCISKRHNHWHNISEGYRRPRFWMPLPNLPRDVDAYLLR